MSMTSIGIVFGVSALVGLPFQIVAGSVADRRGRLVVLAAAVCAATTLYVGLAFARQWWQVAIVVAVESIFGWPMFVTSQNAIVTDLIGSGRRAETVGILARRSGQRVLPRPGARWSRTWEGCDVSDPLPAGGWWLSAIPGRGTRLAQGNETCGSHRRQCQGATRRLCGHRRRPPIPLGVRCKPPAPVLLRTVVVDVSGLRHNRPGRPDRVLGILYALYSFIVAALQYPTIRALRDQDELHPDGGRQRTYWESAWEAWHSSRGAGRRLRCW